MQGPDHTPVPSKRKRAAAWLKLKEMDIEPLSRPLRRESQMTIDDISGENHVPGSTSVGKNYHMESLEELPLPDKTPIKAQSSQYGENALLSNTDKGRKHKEQRARKKEHCSSQTRS
jgi:hypothetical protein